MNLTLVALITQRRGKTTLLNCLGGLSSLPLAASGSTTSPSNEAGSTSAAAHVPVRSAALPRRDDGASPHHHRAESLRRSNRSWPRVEALLDALDLSPHRQADGVGIARAGVQGVASVHAGSRSRGWLLDEPFASAPTPWPARLHGSRVGAVQRATIIYTTQIVEVAESFSGSMVVLNGGRLDYDGPPHHRIGGEPSTACCTACVADREHDGESGSLRHSQKAEGVRAGGTKTLPKTLTRALIRGSCCSLAPHDDGAGSRR